MPDPVKEKAEYQKAVGHNTPMLMQYWKLKSQHFDKARRLFFFFEFLFWGGGEGTDSFFLETWLD